MSRSAQLDGIRGLAVLIVFMSHTSGREMAIAPWLDFTGIGHIGVYLFFVLSGFLLTRNLVAGQDTSTFLIRRFFRIAPLYFIVLLGVFAWQLAGNYSPRYLHITGGPEGLLRHLLFLQGDGVFWTIAAEFIFYLLLPFMVWAGLRWGVRVLIGASLLYFAWFYAIKGFGIPLPAPKLVSIGHTGQFVDVFLCGVIAGMASRKVHAGLAASLLLALLLVTVALVSKNFLGLRQPFYDFRWLSLIYGAGFGFVILSVAQGNQLLAPIFGNVALRFMGVVGFGWYLLHLAVFQAINASSVESPVVRLVIATAGTAILSWLAYVCIEKPGMELGRRFGYRVSRATA